MLMIIFIVRTTDQSEACVVLYPFLRTLTKIVPYVKSCGYLNNTQQQMIQTRIVVGSDLGTAQLTVCQQSSVYIYRQQYFMFITYQ